MPRSPSRNGGPSTFFPCVRTHSSRAKKVSRPPSSADAAAKRCGLIAPQPVDRHRRRNGAARVQTRESYMATIGTFTKSGDDFTGTVKTLALNVKAKIARAEKENDNTTLPITASSPVRPSLARPGRRPPAQGANTSRSSSTIRASRRRSSPRWSRSKVGTGTPSSGLAAPATEPSR